MIQKKLAHTQVGLIQGNVSEGNRVHGCRDREKTHAETVQLKIVFF